MAPPPHTPTTSKKRRHSNLTSDAGNDSESDYNPRKQKQKQKPKPQSSKPAATDQKVVETSDSLPVKPYANAHAGAMHEVGDGEEERAAKASHFPTPPKISCFSKFSKKKKPKSQSTTLSSSQDKSSEYVVSQRITALSSPQQSPSSPYTSTPFQSMITSSGKPIQTTNLLAKHQTRTASGTLPSGIVPNYAEASLPSLDSFDLVPNFLAQPLSPLNMFRKQSLTKSDPGRGQKLSGGCYPAQQQTLPMKSSGVKLRFNLKCKKAASKSDPFEDMPNVTLSPDNLSQQSSSSYKPPIFGPGNSSSILKTRYHPYPPMFQTVSENTLSSSQGGFMISRSTLKHSRISSGGFGGFETADYKEATLENRVLDALQVELGPVSEGEAIAVALLEDNIYKNVGPSDSNFGLDCWANADTQDKVEAEGGINNAKDIPSIAPERHSSLVLYHRLYLADVQEHTNTTEKLYWLQMQAQWAERGGVKTSSLAGLGGEILHLESVKLR